MKLIIDISEEAYNGIKMGMRNRDDMREVGEASKVVKSCDTCKHDEAFGCPSFIHDRCENYSEWEQADREYFCEDYSCIEIEKNCENCEYVSPSESNDNVCRNCDNKSNWKLKQAQADGDLTTALCSLPKIISEDGQDYVQLADVLETVRGYLGDCISKTEAIKTIQQHGVGCFDADDFTPEQCERYVIKLLQDLKPSVAIPSADMFSDLKAEISMYENSEQSIDKMIQGIKSIISIYER